jgi:hypothetical protein
VHGGSLTMGQAQHRNPGPRPLECVEDRSQAKDDM